MLRLTASLLSFSVLVLVAFPVCAQTGKGTWEIQKSGVADDLQGVAFINDNVGVAVGPNNTIIKTTNGGKSWQRVVPRNDNGPDLGEVLFASPKEGWAITTIVNNILHTTDGGDTWTDVPLPGPKGVFGLSGRHHCAHAAHGSTYFYLAWGLSGSHLYRTDNAGKDWVELNKKMNLGDGGHGLAFPDPKNGRFVSAIDVPSKFATGVSSDGGKTWKAQPLKGDLSGNYMKTCFVNKDLGWLIPESGDVHATTDGGKTWMPQHLGQNKEDNLMALHFLDAKIGHVLCKGSNQVRRTVDGGKSWHSLGTIKTEGHLNSMSFPSPQHGWVVGSNGFIAKYGETKGK